MASIHSHHKMLCNDCIHYTVHAHRTKYRGFKQSDDYQRTTNYALLKRSQCYMCAEVLVHYRRRFASQTTAIKSDTLELASSFIIEYSISLSYWDRITLAVKSLSGKPWYIGPSQVAVEFKIERLTSPMRQMWFDDIPLRTAIAKTIRFWLRKCDCDHKGVCKEALESLGATLPTRLLHIVRPDMQIVRLIETEHMALPTPYIALSHCWGGKLPTMCTRSNLESLKSGVYIDDLPSNFRDTIRLASELGFSYVWIDALCIVQDDPNDWSREAPTMDHVYSNAIFVLAAAAAEDSAGGLLHHQFPIRQPTFHLRSPHSEMTLEYRIYTLTQRSETLNLCKLQTRGWVFQERVLAYRNVHVDKDQLFWECREEWSSSHGDLHNRSAIYSSYGQYFPHSFGPPQSTPVSDGTWYNWRALVERYTQRDLTKATDRPVAIAGIAKAFQRKTGDVYCAGLWRSNWVHGIVWHVPVETSPVIVDGPSWSWQTVLSPIIYNVVAQRSLNGGGYLIDVEATGPFKFETDQFSRCLSGSLAITGILLDVVSPLRWQVSLGGDQSRSLVLDDNLSCTWHYVPDQHVEPSEVDINSPAMRILPVCTSWYSKNLHGLVIRSTGHTGNRYRRIGYVRTEIRSMENMPKELIILD